MQTKKGVKIMSLQLRKAERKQARIRIGMSGPSGSGKTYSALLLAHGIASGWDKIAMIDTENRRGDLYSHLGKYNIITLEAPFTPERFIEAIKVCEQAGMEAIIIDSASHEWEGKGGCLESNELLAQSKFKGNTWAAWSNTTPRHQKFIEAIIASPCHIIATTRSKTDTIQTEDKKIKKVGLKEIQREGFEYELTVSFSLDRDGHYAIAGKDNTGLFDKRDPFVISAEDGKAIKEWNESGAKNPELDPATPEQKKEIFDKCAKLGGTYEKLKSGKNSNLPDEDKMTGKQATSVIQLLDGFIAKRETDAAKKEQEKQANTGKISDAWVARIRTLAGAHGIKTDDDIKDFLFFKFGIDILSVLEITMDQARYIIEKISALPKSGNVIKEEEAKNDQVQKGNFEFDTEKYPESETKKEVEIIEKNVIEAMPDTPWEEEDKTEVMVEKK